MAIMHPTKGGHMKGSGSSAKVHKEAGSGSRPGKSSHPIPTSALADHHGLGRKPPGALK